MWTESGAGRDMERAKWTGRSFFTVTSAGSLPVTTVTEKVGVCEGLGQPAGWHGVGCGTGTGPVDGSGQEKKGEGGVLLCLHLFSSCYASEAA
jgi:hypothetical protein